MEQWKVAYKNWRDTQKMTLMAYTDEQMFEIGFLYGQLDSLQAPPEPEKKVRVKK
jgi:hypothetical protein